MKSDISRCYDKPLSCNKNKKNENETRKQTVVVNFRGFYLLFQQFLCFLLSFHEELCCRGCQLATNSSSSSKTTIQGNFYDSFAVFASLYSLKIWKLE